MLTSSPRQRGSLSLVTIAFYSLLRTSRRGSTHSPLPPPCVWGEHVWTWHLRCPPRRLSVCLRRRAMQRWSTACRQSNNMRCPSSLPMHFRWGAGNALLHSLVQHGGGSHIGTYYRIAGPLIACLLMIDNHTPRKATTHIMNLSEQAGGGWRVGDTPP